MIFNIILDTNTKNDEQKCNDMANSIHDLLAGNQDYIDSNIVLNFGLNYEDKPECNLYFSGNECKDKEYIRQKAKEAIDAFVDRLDG